MKEPSRPSRWWVYAGVWLAATAVAVTLGVVAVSSVGASVRDRGPVDSGVRPVTEPAEGSSSPTPGASAVRRTLSDTFGTFVVECRGAVAYGIATTTKDGWRTVSFEPGPDDDVDAVFARRGASIELEIYCNRGQPTIGDRESKTLGDDGSDD